jgi:hypothetical protein
MRRRQFIAGVVGAVAFRHERCAPSKGVAIRERFKFFALQEIYSITWSARSKIDCGAVRPNALAVLRLMINLISVDCCTGKSAGFSPLRMRPT